MEQTDFFQTKREIHQGKKWLKALRSGKYKQTSGTLEDEHGFCCLGVACKLLIPKEQQVRDGDYIHGAFPQDQMAAPEWLKRFRHFPLKYTLDGEPHHNLPAVLNDEKGFSFKRIAQIIQANFPQLKETKK